MSYLSSPPQLPRGLSARRPALSDEPTGIPQNQVSLVRALGPLVLDLGGKEVRLKRRKPREAFLLLLLHRGKSLRMEYIVDALWGSDVPEHPREAARSYLSSVRSWIAAWPRAVSGPVLRSEAGAYGLDLDDSHLDLVQFTRLVTRGQLALREGLPAAAVRDLGEALGLFRGEPLQDASNCTFAVPEIVRLAEMRLEAREARALAKLELGLAASAITDLWDLANERPWRIRSAALLMVSLYRSRRQVEALECAQAFRRALWTEFGEPPDPSFLALERAILNQDAELDRPALIRTTVVGDRAGGSSTSATPGSGRSGRAFTARHSTQVDSGPLLGRAEAEESLVSTLESSANVSIVGPVGCGKSTLAARVATRFRDEMGTHTVAVDLSTSSGAHELRETVGRCLGDRALLRSGERILLVLDNCDALHDQVNQVIGELNGHLPRGFSVLRTSRRRDQAGGVVYRLGPLPSTSPAGSDPEALLTSPAVTLFRQRAEATRRGFEPRPVQILAVARICEAVDCLPLAIEMAAAQTLAVSPVELEPLLVADPFSVLRLPREGSTPPSSMHATFRRTYEQLTSLDRQVLPRLGKIDRPFTLGEAMLVGGPAVVAGLSSLITHSIVTFGHSGGTVRYRMLRTWRAFACRPANHELAAVRQHPHDNDRHDGGTLDGLTDRGPAS
jgi:predicted ATPase/DNA-binding SARP family transcriptional activator